MRALRPELASRDSFVKQVDEHQRPGGYRLVAVVPDEGGDAVAVAGFREGVNLAGGRYLYIDDLSTVPSARGQGFAGTLLTWIHDEAAWRG